MTDRTPGSSEEQPDEPAQPGGQPQGQPDDQSTGHQHYPLPYGTQPYEPGPAWQGYQQPGQQQPGYQQPGYQPGYQQQPGYQPGYQQPGHPGPMTAVQAPVGSKSRGRAGAVVGIIALVLVVGVGGGIGGGIAGYQLAHENASSPTVLDAPKPARSVNSAPDGSVQQVAQKVLPSVVQLEMQSYQGSGEGSGMVISGDGYVLTNNHVAEAARQGRLTAHFHDGRSAPVKVIGSDPKSDLAVVKADIGGLTPVELGRSDDLQVGAPVVAIGSPYGLSETVTSGILSAKDRPVRAGGQQGSQDSVLNALQTDAAINPGNSGGPLVDRDGRVIGINSAIYSPSSGQEQSGSVGLGFAIPIDQAKRIANELKNTGSATHSNLGVMIKPNQRSPGSIVVQVNPGSAAEKAGIRPGDVITKVNDRPTPDPDALIAAVRSHTPGEQVTVTVTGPDGADPHPMQVTLDAEKR